MILSRYLRRASLMRLLEMNALTRSEIGDVVRVPRCNSGWHQGKVLSLTPCTAALPLAVDNETFPDRQIRENSPEVCWISFAYRILTNPVRCVLGRCVRKMGFSSGFSLALLTFTLGWSVVAQHVPARLAAMESPPSDRSSNTAPSFPTHSKLNAKIGLGRHWKVGQSCPIFVSVQLDDAAQKLGSAIIEIDSLDGDGVGVTYRQQLHTAEANKRGQVEAWIPIQLGRANSPIEVRCLSRDRLCEKATLYPEDHGLALPATQPWIVAIGDSLGVERSSRMGAGDNLGSFATSVISDARDVPDNWRSWLGCDLLVIASSAPDILQKLSEKQWKAIEQWIQNGGNCLLSMGDGLEKLKDVAALEKLFPGPLTGRVTRSNPGSLESFVSTDTPIRSFGSNLVRVERGVIHLSLVDESNKRFPWWVRYSHGLGYIQFLASDLSCPQLSEWKDRKLLWDKLLATCWEMNLKNTVNNSADLGGSSYLGYEDLVGQLRATLDYFPTARVLSFGQLTALLIAIVTLIGPVDYYLSVRWLNRPYLSWWFAGSVVALASVGLIWANQAFRPNRTLVNSLEVMDIDVTSAVARGMVWSHVYRPHASRLNVSFTSARGQTQNRTDWQGLPGRGLGGLESTMATDRGMPSYQIDLGAGLEGKIEGIGVPAAGTKCLHTSWFESIEIGSPSSLRETAGVNQLEGIVSNPLDVDLTDAVLVYRNWFYRLPTRLTPGQSVEITFSTVPKDVPRWLNRRSLVNGSEQATRWNPADRQSPGRLMEMLLFYRAASGSSYVKLQHRFQPHVDLSKLIDLDRALLVGRLEKPLGQLHISGGDQVEVSQELQQTWCRVVLPVAQTNRR